MTEYISNAFSPNMVENNVLIISEITKDEFLEAGKTAVSVVGHPEIAENFGLELNRVSIKLEVGDVLYVVTPKSRPKNPGYVYVPEDEGYIYKKIEVKE